MSKNIKVSIIVPAYNEESNIEKCLDSLLNQSLEDIQIIVVDDGSVDNTYQICEQYRKKAKGKIEIIQKKNEGLGFARNEGIKYAKGEYIGFVDSDDWVDPNMFAEMYNRAQKYNLDIVVCDIYKYNAMDSQLEYIKIMSEHCETIDIKKYFLEGKYPQITWNKLYNANIWKNYKFRNIYFEDLDLIMEIVSNINGLGYVERAFYYYHRHDGSISTDYNGEKYFDKFIAYNNIIKKVKKDFQQETVYWVIKNNLECIARKELSAFKANFIDFIKENRELISKNSYLQKADFFEDICRYQRMELITKNIFTRDGLNSKNKEWKKYIRDFKIIEIENEEYRENFFEIAFLKNIYAKGGFYISNNMIIKKPIGSFRFYEIVLFWDKDTKICLDVVGGKSNSPFLWEFLCRINQDSNIQNEVKNLLMEYGLVCNGKSQVLKNNIAVYERNVLLDYFQYL